MTSDHALGADPTGALESPQGKVNVFAVHVMLY